MATLEKSKCSVVMANILFQVFRENCNDFPISFDDFGKQVTEKLYKQFEFLEGNALSFGKKKHKVFDAYCDCVANAEQSVLEMVEPISLKDDTDHLSIDDVRVNEQEIPKEVSV